MIPVEGFVSFQVRMGLEVFIAQNVKNLVRYAFMADSIVYNGSPLLSISELMACG